MTGAGVNVGWFGVWNFFSLEDANLYPKINQKIV